MVANKSYCDSVKKNKSHINRNSQKRPTFKVWKIIRYIKAYIDRVNKEWEQLKKYAKTDFFYESFWKALFFIKSVKPQAFLILNSKISSLRSKLLARSNSFEDHAKIHSALSVLKERQLEIKIKYKNDKIDLDTYIFNALNE